MNVCGRHVVFDVPPAPISGTAAPMTTAHQRSPRIRIGTIAAALCITFLGLVGPGASTAGAEIKRETLQANPKPSGQLMISPGRLEFDAEPGVRTTYDIMLTNDSGDGVDISVLTTDLGQSADPRSVATKVEQGEYGAGDWLTSEVEHIRLAAWERVTFQLVIDPPLDAPVGTNFAGLVIDSTVADGEIGTEDSTSAFRIEGLIQIFPTITGAIKHDIRVTDVKVRDALVIGSQRFATWDVTFENNGTVNEHVTGSVTIRSMFGNAAHRVDIKELLVLRGAKRTQRVIWRDLPWVGAFTPEVRVRGDDARLVKASGERVVVLPWWLPFAIVVAILAPAGWLWWRRRREWLQYLDEEIWDDEGAPTR